MSHEEMIMHRGRENSLGWVILTAMLVVAAIASGQSFR